MKIVTASQMAELEMASERRGVSTDNLMEQAGLAVARTARTLQGGVAGKRVLVLVGPGNNGADGLVAARHLRRWGAEVTAYLLANRPGEDPKMDLARSYDVHVLRFQDDPGFPSFDRNLAGASLVIDAVLGTGRRRPLEGPIRDVMLRVGTCRSRTNRPNLLALDLPTGLDSDTGAVDPACPQMDVTVALGRPKLGLLTFPGAAHVGELNVVDIGLPTDLEEEQRIPLELLTPQWVGARLPSRPLESHKGTFGHALVIAGSGNYVGAAFLASQAAVRVGAGLVTLASPSGIYPMAATKLTEVIHLPLPQDELCRVHAGAADVIAEQLGRYTAVALGCGMGWSSGTEDFLQRMIQLLPPEVPCVIDADGINNLSTVPNWWQHLKTPTVLTPHPGEMAALTGNPTASVQQDRVAVTRKYSSDWGVTVVLKGAHTVIGFPGGGAMVSPFANPALASGGTGDVLTGIIAGLMAQGLSPGDAACCGVYLHGQAGEAVRRRLGDTGAIATDLIERLSETITLLRDSV